MKILVFDIGGTAIKSAVYENGALFDVRETATDAHLGGAYLIEKVKSLVEEYRKVHTIDRLGISTAGQVDPKQGCITYANDNIPGYTGMPVGQIMEDAFGIPTRVENDVKAAALGEGAFGAGKGVQDFICLTYGTGVGGAIVADGKLYSGSNFAAGQFGALLTHPEDRCGDGDFYSGGYEKYASTSALVQRAKRYDSELTSGKKIFSRLEDPKVNQIIDSWIDEIVLGLCSIVHMLNPAMVVLGGGIMEQPYVTDQVRNKLMPCLMPTYRHVQIKSSTLGNRAGLFGAAALWMIEEDTAM